MGSGGSRACLGTDTSTLDDCLSIFHDFMEDRYVHGQFESSLISGNRKRQEKGWEIPDDNFLVDIVTSPCRVTEHKSARDALLNVIFPRFNDADRERTMIDELLIFFFENAEREHNKYMKERKVCRERAESAGESAELRSICVCEPEGFETVDQILEKIRGWSPCEGSLEKVCAYLATHITDMKSACVAVMFGFYTNDCSSILAALTFLWKNQSAALPVDMAKCEEWMIKAKLSEFAFVPTLDADVKVLDIVERPVRNAMLASNGRYWYISKEKGAITSFVQGYEQQTFCIARKHEIMFAVSDDVLFITTLKKEYIYRAFPFEMITRRDKAVIRYPFCSDGRYIYSLSKSGDQVNVYVVDVRGANKAELKRVASVKFAVKMTVKDTERSTCIMYCNGAVVTFMVPEKKENVYRIVHYSVFNGEHLGSEEFSSPVPLHSVVFDPFRRVYLVVSVFSTVTKIIEFESTGAIPVWLSGFDFGILPNSRSVYAAIRGAKTGNALALALIDLLKLCTAHSVGFEVSQRMTRDLFMSSLGKFVCPLSETFFASWLEAAEFCEASIPVEVMPTLLALLHINLFNMRKTHGDVIERYSDRILALLVRLRDNEKFAPFMPAIVFCTTNAQNMDKGRAFLAEVFKQAPIHVQLACCELRRDDAVLGVITPETCRELVGPVLDRVVKGEHVTFLEMAFIDKFQRCLMHNAVGSGESEFKHHVAKVFHAYMELTFEHFLQFMKGPRPDRVQNVIVDIFRRFMFMLRPIVGSSKVARTVLPYLLKIMNILYGTLGKDMQSEGHLSHDYSRFFYLLFICAACIRSLLAGGSEVRETAKFLKLYKGERWDFEKMRRIAGHISGGKFTRELCEEYNCLPKKYIDILEAYVLGSRDGESIFTVFTEVYRGIHPPFMKVMEKSLSSVGRMIEKVLLLVLVKTEDCFDELDIMTDKKERTEKLLVISRFIGEYRRAFIHMMRDIRGSTCGATKNRKESDIEECILRKCLFLLFVDSKMDRRTVSAFLGTATLTNLLDALEDGRDSMSYVSDSFGAIENVMQMDKKYGLFMIRYLVHTRFWTSFCWNSIRNDQFDTEFMKSMPKLFRETESVVIFYLVLIMCSEGSDNLDLALRTVRDHNNNTSKSMILLVLAVFYERLEFSKVNEHESEVLLAENNKMRNALKQILFENTSEFTYRDVPILRLCLQTGIDIPQSFDDILNIFKESPESYMHSIMGVVADFIERSDDQSSMFRRILREIGTIAMCRDGFFSNFSGEGQLSICDQLIKIMQMSLENEVLHGMLVSILKKNDDSLSDREFLFAVFAILSESLSVSLHSHFLVRNEQGDGTYYITEIGSDGKSIKGYRVPFKYYSVHQEVSRTKFLVPISESPFTVDRFPETDLLIPYFSDAMTSEEVDPFNYYVIQSLKVFIACRAFLVKFLDTQSALKIERYTFVDFSHKFVDMLRFQLQHPIFESSNAFFALSGDESFSVSDGQIRSEHGKRFAYSEIFSDSTKVTIRFKKVEGTVRVGIQSLSFFAYDAMAYKYDFQSKELLRNCIKIDTKDKLSEMTYDSGQRQLLFDDHVVNVEDASYCFVIMTGGSARVDFEVDGSFEGHCTFKSEMPYQTLATETEGDIFRYPPEQSPSLSDVFDGRNLTEVDIDLPLHGISDIANSMTCDVLSPFENKRISSRLNAFYTHQILRALQYQINSQILVNSLRLAQDIDYISEQFDLSHPQLIDFAIAILTLIEPLYFDKCIINFKSDLLVEKSPEHGFACVEKILEFLGPAESLSLWYTILNNKMNAIPFHFVDTHKPNFAVFTVNSLSERKRVHVARAKGFIVFKGGFSRHIKQIAVVNGEKALSGGIVYVEGNYVDIQAVPGAPPSQHVICVPLYRRPNTALFDTFVELAVAFKYFVLYAKKHEGQAVSHDDFRKYKLGVYKMFFDTVNFESPFFASHVDEIYEFLDKQIPLGLCDADEQLGSQLALLGIYSRDLPCISAFMKCMKTMWSERPLIRIMSYFPMFMAESDRITPDMCVDAPLEILPSLFPSEMVSGHDYAELIEVIRNLLLKDNPVRYRFYYLLDLWASMAWKYPPFMVEDLPDKKIKITFEFDEPESFEFVFREKGMSLTKVDDVYQSSVDLCKLRFVIVNNSPLPKDRLYSFVLDHRERVASDIESFIENRQDDQLLMGHFTEKDMEANQLSLNIDAMVLMNLNSTASYHELAVRGTVLKALNWIFVHKLVDFGERTNAGLCRFLSRSIRIGMLSRIIEKKSGYRPANVTVNRLADSEERECLFSQVIRQYTTPDKFRVHWNVHWENEPASGVGPANELLTGLVHCMFSRDTGLFVAFGDKFIPAASRKLEKDIEWLRFVGVTFGMILRANVPSTVDLHESCWRFLCGDELSIDDIYEIDQDYKREIDVLRYASKDTFEEREFVEKDIKGDLVPLGDGKLTFDRIPEFIALSNQSRLSRVTSGLKHIRDGLLENLNIDALPAFVTPGLLKIAICGEVNITPRSTLEIIEFVECTSKVRDQIKHIIESFSVDLCVGFIRYVTNFDSIPARNNRRNPLIRVQMDTNSHPDNLPTASTCFCRLEWPQYSSVEVAREKLVRAINCGGAYGIA